MALLMTLWIGVLLAVVGAGFALSMRTGLASTRNFKEDTIAYYEAVAGFEDALVYLSGDRDAGIDFLDVEGGLMLEEDAEPFESLREIDGFGTVEVTISDESSRIDLNAASRGALQTLLVRSGLEEPEAAEIADAILDWRDPDSDQRNDGAEDDDYEGDGYEAKDGPFSTVEELLLVRGMDEDILYGNPERELSGIYDQLSVCRGGGINVNTVTVSTMEALGMDYACIDQVTRLQQAGPIRQVPACAARYGVRSASSRCFLVRASATPQGTNYTRTIEAVVSRRPKAGRYEVQVRLWRDDVS